MPSVAAVFSLWRPKCSSVASVSCRSTSASGVPTRMVSVGGPALAACGVRCSPGRQSSTMRRAGRHHVGALDDVAQLAHVARPAVARPAARSDLAARSACFAPSRSPICSQEVLGDQRRRPRPARAAAAGGSGTRSAGTAGPRAACRWRPPASGSRLVAAITRTSASCTWVEPTRMKVPVSSTRSSLTCRSSGISVISSRNSVPPLARSKKPRCWRSAPVKLPFSWPKISLSIRCGEIAPQLTARNGLRAAPAQVVHGARDDLLAGAALAGDEHRDRRAGDARRSARRRAASAPSGPTGAPKWPSLLQLPTPCRRPRPSAPTAASRATARPAAASG